MEDLEGLERSSPGLLARWLQPDYQLFPHIQLLSNRCVDLVSGVAPRQLWSAPNQYGKSMLGSRWLPLWFLENFPHKRVLIAAYAQELAALHARWIRNAIKTHGGKLSVTLSEDSRAAHRWNTPQGGGLYAVGIQGGATGHSADLLIVDDAFVDFEDCQNPEVRDAAWSFFADVGFLRLQAEGMVLVIQTRLNQDDLIGRLLVHSESVTDRARKYVHTRLPALAEDPNETGFIDPLGRAPGEALCPQLHSLADVHEAMSLVLPHKRPALFQQDPSPPEGSMFSSTYRILGPDEEIPKRSEFVAMVRSFDLASTANRGDFTVGVLLGRHKDGSTWILDVVRGRWSAGVVVMKVAAAAAWDKAEFGKVPVRLEKEISSSAEIVLASYRAAMPGVDIDMIKVVGSKPDRATPLALAVGNGSVVIAPKRDTWNVKDYIDEHDGFQNGATHDDQVDASSLGFNWLEGEAAKPKVVHVRSALDTEPDLIDSGDYW